MTDDVGSFWDEQAARLAEVPGAHLAAPAGSFLERLDSPALWGHAIDDERYVVLSTRDVLLVVEDDPGSSRGSDERWLGELPAPLR